MPTPQDYETARVLAIEKLAQADLTSCCRKAGVVLEDSAGQKRVSIPFLGKVYDLVIEPAASISFDQRVQPIKLQDQVLLLHYLITASGAQVEDKWVTFREVPAGPFYYPSFVKRAIAPLVQCFGSDPDTLIAVAQRIGEAMPQPGDVAVKILALPRVPVVLTLWRGDDEFAPEGNVLFDASVGSYLDTEDIAYLAGVVVYTMIGFSRRLSACSGQQGTRP
ncbi:MAG: DUF3786 domain-containing protein [Deltaproteobacteria bacterium]|nr:DUF3786 domain-containing protein [Deltaproteobacteria bacterium]